MRLNVFKNKTVLITGHTGFKGSWLSLWLLSLGAKVVGVSNDIPTEPSHFIEIGLSGHIRDNRFDICDLHSLQKLIDQTQPDFIFHLAAQSLVGASYLQPGKTWLTNCVGTINLLESLRGYEKECSVVLITSDKCYENVEWVWGYRENDKLGGLDPYSASKAGAEIAIRSYVSSYFSSKKNVRVGIGRAGNVIGGGDWSENRIVPDCIRAWAVGEKVILRNSKATRPWQHVLEPLSGYLGLAMSLNDSFDCHGEPFNFGPSVINDYSVKNLVIEMARHWNGGEWVDLTNQYEGPLEAGLLKLNCDKALYHLGWHATWDFTTTVSETVSWYNHYYHNSTQDMMDISIEQINSYVKSAHQQSLLWAS
jgi:CDP-glucose 4,6-dehydratase